MITGRMSHLAVPVIVVLIVGLVGGPLGEVVFAARPSCDTAGTTVVFAGETCDGSGCTWEYEVCQTGFSLSHWVLGACDCLESHLLEVGYVDAQGNKTVLSECTEGQTTPCWEFGLDPTTGLSGLKWDSLPGPENECWTFYLTIDQDVDETALNWTSKFAACPPGTGTVAGPACPCGCGQIIAFKYYDVNENGTYDQGDYELAGWEVCLNGDCRVTDEMGFVDFGCQSPGTYVLCETPMADWFNSEPAGGCYNVSLGAGEQARLHFGNYELPDVVLRDKAYIRASKYYDYNENGVRDDPLYPMNDWEVCLDGHGCKTTRNICMLCGGCTDYWEVEPGTYTLCESSKDGWTNTDPGVAPPCKEVTVEAGEFLCVSFGNIDVEVAVGGEVYPVDKRGLLAPWIAVAVAVMVGGVLLLRRRARA